MNKTIKQKILSNLPLLITLGVICFIFSNFIFSPVTIGGDFNFVSYNHFKVYSQKPYVWDSALNNGFGQVTLFTLPFFYYAYIANKVTSGINNPFLLHKLIFFIPLLIIMVTSIYYLVRKVINNKWAQSAAVLLYILNPYSILLIAGGQLGVAFAYAFSPVVFALFYQTVHKIQNNPPTIIKTKWYLITGLATALLISFDSRLALLLISSVALLYIGYWLCAKNKRDMLVDYLQLVGIVGSIVLGFHAYWLLPSLFVQSIELPQGYATDQAVQFFSFGRLAHTVTWTHPNYPQNIFGVVKEVSGWAFVIPLAAFFILKKPRKVTIYLALLALISAFFAKGTNEPFGNLYLLAFQHIPLFSWFRDSTKFFLLLSIAYALLIGLSVQELVGSTMASSKKVLIGIVSSALIAYIWFPTFSHQIKGTLAYRTYPQEFQAIEKSLQSDHTFGRVLWIPSREMYGYEDLNHPAVSLQELRNYPNCLPTLCTPQDAQPNPNKKEFTKNDLFKQIDDETRFLADPYTQDIFQELAINYVILSPDKEKSIYMYDRKYDQEVKDYYQSKINHLAWLIPLNIKNVSAYSNQHQGSLFMTNSGINTSSNSFKMMSPVEYEVSIDDTNAPLIFSERYDERWVLKKGSTTIYPMENKVGLMEFPTAEIKQGKAKIIFTGQTFATIGWTISTFTILLTLGMISIIQIKGKPRTA